MSEPTLFLPHELVSPETRQKWHQRIEYLLEAGEDRLTDWEAAFVQDVEKQLADGRDLSLRQSSKLNQIYHVMEEKMG